MNSQTLGIICITIMAILPATWHSGNINSSQEPEEKVTAKPEHIAQNTTLAPESGTAGDSEEVATPAQDSDTFSTNVFSDPVVAAHYVDVYEKAHYECRHVFDAELEWTKTEERRVVRKLDWHGIFPCKALNEEHPLK